jgi:hypothetical protein
VEDDRNWFTFLAFTSLILNAKSILAQYEYLQALAGSLNFMLNVLIFVNFSLS